MTYIYLYHIVQASSQLYLAIPWESLESTGKLKWWILPQASRLSWRCQTCSPGVLRWFGHAWHEFGEGGCSWGRTVDRSAESPNISDRIPICTACCWSCSTALRQCFRRNTWRLAFEAWQNASGWARSCGLGIVFRRLALGWVFNMSDVFIPILGYLGWWWWWWWSLKCVLGRGEDHHSPIRPPLECTRMRGHLGRAAPCEWAAHHRGGCQCPWDAPTAR